MTNSTKRTIAAALLLVFGLLIPSAYLVLQRIPSGSSTTRNAANAPADPPESAGTTTLTGTVRDDAGNPIPDATVTQGSSPFAADRSFHLTTTDGEGRFSLPGVKVGADLLLTATATGRSPQMVRGIVAPVSSAFSISLAPGHIIKFRLLDERGDPIPGADVSPVDWKGEDVLRPYAKRSSHGMIADADGRVVWDSAPAEAVQFFLSERHHRTLAVEVSPSERENVFTLRDPMHVTVNVIDAQTKAAVPEFAVTMGQGMPEQPGWWGPTKVGVSGSYELANAEGHQLVKVEAAGYPAMIQAIPTDKSVATMTFVLSKGAATNVTFVTPEGRAATDLALYVITAPDGIRLHGEYPHAGLERHVSDAGVHNGRRGEMRPWRPAGRRGVCGRGVQ